MGRGGGSIWCLVLLIPGVQAGCYSEVVIDGYTNASTLTSGDSVPLGTQIILICRVVGLPYGTPLSYTWTCPNEPCEVEGYYGRKIYNEHILAVNITTTTTTSDGGTYTCWVTAVERHQANGSFTFKVTGGSVVHSFGRLIPHEFPITELQQISGPDGMKRITCTVSSGTAGFVTNDGVKLETGALSETQNGATATLAVKPSNVGSFQNRDLYCTNSATNFFYLFLSNANSLMIPSLATSSATNSKVEYEFQAIDAGTTRLIAGYEVTRFGVPMIGQYKNTGRGRRVTISHAVPGAQYRITAWALADVIRSTTPAVVYVTTGGARPSSPRNLSITRQLEDGIELNWLPPTEPNGEVHYVIYYTAEGGTEQSNDTGSNLTHYNLTGLERNRMYTNISVQAVNSAGRSERSAAIAQHNLIPPDAQGTNSPSPTRSSGTSIPDTISTSGPASTAALIAGVVVAFVAVILLTLVGGMVMVAVVVVRRKRKKENGQSHSKAYLEDSLHGGKETIDDMNMYQNVQTPASGHSDPYYSTPTDNFANPASATASFGAHVNDSADYSEADQRPLDIYEGGLYEDASAEASQGGGGYKEKPVKGARGAQKISDVLTKPGYELMKPEELYTQPDKSAKMKKGIQGSKKDKENAAPVEDLYTVPDMAKKRQQRNQQQSEEENEEARLPSQAPLPYKQHKDAKHESEEDEEGNPELPPPYVPGEEQYCNTGDRDGPSSSERMYEAQD